MPATMKVVRRTPGPAYANLQRRKPREGIRQAVRRMLSKIECCPQFRFITGGFSKNLGVSGLTTFFLQHSATGGTQKNFDAFKLKLFRSAGQDNHRSQIVRISHSNPCANDRQTCQGSDPTRTSSAASKESPLSRPKNTIAFAPDFGARGRARCPKSPCAPRAMRPGKAVEYPNRGKKVI